MRARHHLLDAVEPDTTIDAARWAELAEHAIADIRSRGKRALLAGGTFLWVRALLHGLAEAPPADAELRARHRTRAEREGRAALHAELGRVDPVLAEKLQPNDFVRVSRALEVWELTGVPLSRWQAEHGFRARRHEARLVGIRHAPAELDRRIRARVEAMLDSGWIEEVRGLMARQQPLRALGSVGYRQITEALASGQPIDRAALAEAIARKTRVFARRQRTWLRDQPVLWLDAESAFCAPPAELWQRIQLNR
jgi:tRNA dimethylallyltransferase